MGRGVLLVIASCLFAGCGDGNSTSSNGKSQTTAKAAARVRQGPAFFHDVSKDVGLDFVHCNGMTGELYFPELMGGGGALFDFDNDGDLDVYLVQGAMLGGKKPGEATFPPDKPLRDRLFRNDLTIHADGRREIKLVDVTSDSLINSTGCGMGVTTGDYNNDGWIDLYVTNWGSNQLWKNNGDNTFSDQTKTAGVDVPLWSTSAAMADFNRDGFLDLFVCNYINFTYKTHKPCYHKSGSRVYCGPKSDVAMPDRLFLNNGNGTFKDVTGPSQIARAFGAGLGVVCSDFNRDGWVDIYVANDAHANQLWINQKDGRFKNDAMLNGCAYNRNGNAEGSMGVDAGDIDNDGDDDLFMTHIDVETNTFYLNDGQGGFEDETLKSGLGLPSRGLTAFGTGFFDYDNDGWLDLFVVNGAVNFSSMQDRSKDPYPLRQRDQLFNNLGNGRFKEVSFEAGPCFDVEAVGRGVAFGDIDNDGDTDLLVVNNSGPARILRNDMGNRRQWIGFRLTDQKRDLLGAVVEVVVDQKTRITRRLHTDGSYCSANDPRVLVGLADVKTVQRVRVRWPTGESEEWSDVAVGKYNRLQFGKGRKSK